VVAKLNCLNSDFMNLLMMFPPQVLLRFPWCPQTVQCLKSMCLLDTFNRWVITVLLI